jgi:hypothetical protein
MKTISKLLLSLAFILLIGSSAKAQEPNFTVNWNSYCEVQSQDSYYKVTWALVYIPTQTSVKNGDVTGISLLNSSQLIEIIGWDCNIDEFPLNYRILVQVDRYQNDDETISCTGQARSSAIRCSELYDGSVTIPVNLTYP